MALILPAAIVLGIAAFETRIFYPPPSNAPAAGIVWHGRTFAARDDFARWLRSRGVRYAVWARRHQAFLSSRRRTRAQYAAGSERASQKGLDGNVGRLGVGDVEQQQPGRRQGLWGGWSVRCVGLILPVML